MPLIENCVAHLGRSGEIGIVGVLAGNIGINVVNRMRPHVAGEQADAAAEAMRQIHV